MELDQRVGGPSIHTKICVSMRVENPRVVEQYRSNRDPSFSRNKLPSGTPGDGVSSCGKVGVVDRSSSIRERVKVPVVGTSSRCGCSFD